MEPTVISNPKTKLVFLLFGPCSDERVEREIAEFDRRAEQLSGARGPKIHRYPGE